MSLLAAALASSMDEVSEALRMEVRGFEALRMEVQRI